MRTGLVALCALAAPVSASAVEPEQAGPSSIVDGGQSDALREFVAIDAGDRTCTGSLVSIDGLFVLTASSCIPDGLAQDGITARPNPDLDVAGARSLSYQRHHTVDAALVRLDAPLDLPSIPLASGLVNNGFVNRAVQVVGFGETAPGAGDGGELRWAWATVVGSEWYEFTTSEFPGALCEGDLGAAALVFDGFGFLQVGLGASTHCGAAPDTFVRTDRLVAWLRGQGVALRTTYDDAVMPFSCEGDGRAVAVTDALATGEPISCTPPTAPAAGERFWRWGDGSESEAIDGAESTHTYATTGDYGLQLCERVPRDNGTVRHRCSPQVWLTLCPTPDASFIVDVGDDIIAIPTGDDPACHVRSSWLVLDRNGVERRSSELIQPHFELQHGTYEIVHRVETTVGTDEVSQTVQIGEGGCSTLSGRAVFGVLPLWVLIWGTRRRRSAHDEQEN